MNLLDLIKLLISFRYWYDMNFTASNNRPGGYFTNKSIDIVIWLNTACK